VSVKHIFPLRVGISYNFGLIGKDFSSRSLRSGKVPTIFIGTDSFNHFYKSDALKALKGRLRIEFREEEKDSIKEYFNYLVENSWDKMESFFGSYGIKLPEKGKVSESLSKSFIDYLKGVTEFFNEIFSKYDEIEYREKDVPLILDEILDLASEVSNLCLYSINIKDPDDPYVYLSFEDVREALEVDDEKEHPLKSLEKINLTEEDLIYLKKGEDPEDNSIDQKWLEKLKGKSRRLREVLEYLAEAIFYRDGFLYFNSQSIDKLVHVALSMGGRFYSLFPKVNVIRGPRGEDEFLVTANIAYRTAFLSEKEEVPFPAILVSIESSAKRENGREVKLTYESKKQSREIGPVRAGFGFLIDLSNNILERKYETSLFHEEEIIENIEFYPENGDVIVENYGSYFVYLRTKVNFKSGAVSCPSSFSYLRLEEKVSEEAGEASIRVPKVFFTSLVFESPESEDLDLDEFIEIYSFLFREKKEKKPGIGKLLENLLPSDSLVMSTVSSYLGFAESKKYEFIRPPFYFYNGEGYEKEYLMDSLIKHELVPIAVPKPEKRIKGKEIKKESNQWLSISDLELYKYFISNSVIIEKMLYPFLITVVAEEYFSEGRSDLCFNYDKETRIRIFPKIWEEMENEIRRNLPFKKVGGLEPWEYKSEKVENHSKDETLHFKGSIDSYFAEKTKLAVNYEEEVKEEYRKGLFYALSWATLADLKEIREEIGEVEQIRKELFGE
jgi:hypothetical protein